MVNHAEFTHVIQSASNHEFIWGPSPRDRMDVPTPWKVRNISNGILPSHPTSWEQQEQEQAITATGTSKGSAPTGQNWSDNSVQPLPGCPISSWRQTGQRHLYGHCPVRSARSDHQSMGAAVTFGKKNLGLQLVM
ncbi:hypothetical protein PGT21_013516 [Puccinia graminis f. sp. tritici]|uniref:Uncharacterized protein n=2 Tax=Puccinia graminis f. sp. tritici TaxID=56615 RepID=A0A5B0NVJ3_PUCGR|nr:hypothetical protein PGT21_013516 [Puccinia graminis f. sp. tritici]KAA1091859.1 hypothetical protein PGTUg99_011384 [Puccinia graminis f. sp. tritici]